MRETDNPISAEWLPAVAMRRIIMHWTAGAHTPNAVDKRAYHVLIDGEGRVHRGNASVSLNAGILKPGYAAHTLHCNTDSIGVSLCGMAGATEAPFNAGKFPVTAAQIEALVKVCQQLTRRYDIRVTRQTVLSHAEVQSTLGIQQRNKWDFTRLPDDVCPVRGAHEIGDWLRAKIAGEPVQNNARFSSPLPDGATARVTASSLNARRSPNGEVTGSIPAGTLVSVRGENGKWLRVETPAGFEVWVSREHVEIVDGPRPAEPTTPDPRRALIADLRGYLDALEAAM